MRARAWDSACTLHQCGCDRLPRNGTWSFAYINRSQGYFETIEAFDKSRAKFATCNVRNVCIRKMKRKKGAKERPGVLFSVFTIDEVCVCTDVHASGEVSHYLRVNDSTSWWTILRVDERFCKSRWTNRWTILRVDERFCESRWTNRWTVLRVDEQFSAGWWTTSEQIGVGQWMNKCTDGGRKWTDAEHEQLCIAIYAWTENCKNHHHYVSANASDKISDN